MELQLTKEQRQVAHAAATEDSRPVLTAVCIRGNKLLAADGYVLAETTLTMDPLEQDVLLPAKDILKAKDMKGTSNVFIHTNGETDRAHLMDADGERIIPFIQGTFPNTDQLYPAKERVFRIGLSCDVLQTILKVAGKGNHVKLTFYGEDQPVKFESPNTDAQGLAMPFAVRWEDQ